MNKKVFLTVILLALLLATLPLAGCAPAVATPADVTAPAAATQANTLAPSATTAPSATSAPTQTTAPTATPVPASIEDVIAWEMKGSFDFFWERANTEAGSPGYGLIRDRYPGSEGIASMASVGYGLTAYVIGVEKGYITRVQGIERASKTLDTLLNMERNEGFYYHFVDMKTGKRAWNSEVSSIDSTILLMGVVTAGEYFGGEVQAKATQIYDGFNWSWFLDPGKDQFYMAYRPEKGFEGHWDFYAEQLMMYVLAAGSNTHPIEASTYYAFTRHYASYGGGEKFIHSWFGSIFTYQYSHAWVDFRKYADKDGVNWFDNSVLASQAQYDFAVDEQSKYKTIGPLAWGLTASDGPGGYNGLIGAPPSGFDNRQHQVDDTVAPSGAIGSIIFLPEQVKAAMLNYYSYDKLKGPYGFKDAYNLSKKWFASDVIGIDKGVTLLMLSNYEGDTVYKITMKNPNLLKGLERLQIKPAAGAGG